MENSFVLKQTGRPQDVAATLISVNRQSDQIVQLVPKDPQQMENGGGHPWTIENGVNSTLLLFNPAGKAVTFTVNIPIGNKKLWSKLYVLQPGETKSISLRELVERQAKDKDDVLLPKDLQGGEVTWLTPDPGEGLGRVIQTDESRLLARNFSCGNYIVLCSNSLANNFAGLIVGFDGYLGQSQCAGLHDSANYIVITHGSGTTATVTKYYHTTILPGLGVNSPVSVGQQIGTVDTSGCSSGPHTHIELRINNVLVNFTLPCDNSHFDAAGTWYDDGP